MVTHIIVLEMYDDDEDIPQDILDLIAIREKEYNHLFSLWEKLKEV